MARRHLVHSLEARLTESLARYSADASGWALRLPEPSQLEKRACAIAAQFDEGKPAEPPSQARINALARLRRNDPNLTRKDWGLIAWGLCDECGLAGRPIEDASLFDRVMQYVDVQTEDGGISRKIWFGLLHSYFAYALEHPETNPRWLTLRATLVETLPALLRAQSRPKAWAKALENNAELLTDQAGKALGRALFDGRADVSAEIATYLPIPESSWLWRRVIIEQLHLLFKIPDHQFYPVIPAMLGLARQHPQQADNVLSAVLTRYERSAARDEAHIELKEFALSQWQNPQVKSSNRWSLVADEVRKMVLHWFAKADLEHFFSLLQGEGGVDRARLNYWLRFVDQIGYTRIVMGNDAYYNRHPNFVDFRAKNKGRFSGLQGGDPANNAFVIRIGEFYFVEFSGKGNACYIYAAGNLPFNSDQQTFHLTELKRPRAATDRIIHNGDWEHKSDYLLARIGIFPGSQRNSSRRANTSESGWQPVSSMRENTSSVDMTAMTPRQPQPASVNGQETARLATAQTGRSTAAGTPATSSQSVSPPNFDHTAPGERISRAQAVKIAEALAKSHNVRHEDNRTSGGAFWILERTPDSELGTRLTSLGFRFLSQRGYWIK